MSGTPVSYRGQNPDADAILVRLCDLSHTLKSAAIQAESILHDELRDTRIVLLAEHIRSARTLNTGIREKQAATIRVKNRKDTP